MKRKINGFTLTELLAVIVILGVIALIVIPVIDRVNDRAREELYIVQKNNIINAAKNWSAKNFMLLPEDDGDSITITIGQLKLSSFLDKDITNPKSKLKFPNDMEITIKRVGLNYDYELLEETGSDDGNIYEDTPIITLNGQPHEIVEIHSNYVDKGAVAKDPTGSLIEEYTTLIKSNNVTVDELDTTKYIQYKIIYTVEYNGKTSSAIRTVTVKDTIPPVLTIPGNMNLLVADVSEFNAMDGVSATDNSLEEPTIAVGGALSPLVGDYTLTYTAMDSSGNKTIKTRVITVSQ